MFGENRCLLAARSRRRFWTQKMGVMACEGNNLIGKEQSTGRKKPYSLSHQCWKTLQIQCRSQWGLVNSGEDLSWQVWAEFPALSHSVPCDLLQNALCVCFACLASLTLHILLVQNVFYCALYIPYHCVAIPSLCRATELCLFDFEDFGISKGKPVQKTGCLNSVFFTSSAIVRCFVFHLPNLTYIPFLLLHPALTYLGLNPNPSPSSHPPTSEDSLFSWPSNLTLIPSQSLGFAIEAKKIWQPLWWVC